MTRRTATQRGLVLGGAVVAAAAAPRLLPLSTALASADSDEAVLRAALRLEQRAVVTYEAAAQSGALDGPAGELAGLFARQERAHAEALTSALEALGGSAPPPPEASELAGPSLPGSQAAWARFLIALELKAVAAYYRAQDKLNDPGLLSLAARIMANQGQHLALLRPLAGATSVPHAFERGVA